MHFLPDLKARSQLLQVWIGKRVAPAPSSPAWNAVLDSPRPWQQGGSHAADGPSNVACRIVPAHTAAPVGASDLQACSLCRRDCSLNKSGRKILEMFHYAVRWC